MARGKVFWRNNELVVRWEKVKGGVTALSQATPVRDTSVIEAMKQLGDVKEAEVDVELVSGTPSRITFVDEELSAKAEEGAQEEARLKEERLRKAQESESENGESDQDFHNSYNFVAAPDRSKVKNELGDHAPVGHDLYHNKLYDGKLCVKMRAVTPVLLPDTARVFVEKCGEKESDIHKSFYVRIGPDERPVVSPTALKGMLRAAYEAITNSRLSVFSSKHSEKLTYREGMKKKFYQYPPAELLPKTLKPSDALDSLSPADRVFGWVGQAVKKNNAYRGQVRFGVVMCKSNDAIEYFEKDDHEKWLPLQILGEPKPQQGRFYVAKDKSGNAQSQGLTTEQAGYNDSSKGLRGRKVYPHHANLPAGYWIAGADFNNELTDGQRDLSQGELRNDGHAVFREYIRPKTAKRRDSQNRSIQGWVKEGVEFAFDIHFNNLSKVELGALIWLLSLNDGLEETKYFHRFGGGKPLGFGSVSLHLDSSQITSGEDLKEFYQSLGSARKESISAGESKAAFEAAYLSAGYQRIIAAFLRASQGFGDKLPTHYPRARHSPGLVPPHPDGLAYEWFVENAKASNQDNPETRLVLSDLVNDKGESDPGLPLLNKT